MLLIRSASTGTPKRTKTEVICCGASWKLVTFNCEKKKDELVKDLFVFSCFTGLSYSDIKGLKNSNLQEFFDGNKWIIVRRRKTATSSNVMLLDIPKMIIEKYAGLSKDGKVFPVPCNSSCNNRLRAISRKIDCLKEKKVTFHLARIRLPRCF